MSPSHHPPGTAVALVPPATQPRPLPCPVGPIHAETLQSYLHRVTAHNLLRPQWLSDMSGRPYFTATLATLTGLSVRHLVSALPELRSPPMLTQWPHLIGKVSANAGKRPGCTHCAAARTGDPTRFITVFASQEQLICHTHHRWIGTADLKCSSRQQFGLHRCPDIAAANIHHRHLIKKWGHGPVRAGFYEAITCLSTWARWPALISAPDIQKHWHTLGITEQSTPLQPREVAAWYPHAVSVTELILTTRQQLSSAGSSTTAILADASHRLQRIIPGLIPSGAGDPFRQALFATAHPSGSEVEMIPHPKESTRSPQLHDLQGGTGHPCDNQGEFNDCPPPHPAVASLGCDVQQRVGDR